MVERDSYPDGEPCWVDVLTPDLAAGKRFYQAMFGWQFQDSGSEFGNYTMCEIDGKPVAGIMPPPPGGEAPPPAWSVYLASSDITATATKIDQGGGKIVMGPMEIPGSGHMLMASDPTGAFFGVWQGTGHIGARIDTEPGTLAWSEVHTRDGAAADAFYRGLFGYELVDVGGGIEYTVWSLAGNQVAGRMTMGAEFGPEIPPHWMAYFAVDDADAAAERATQAGGQLAQGPFDSPYGRIAIIADPHGASFSAIDMSRRSAS